MRLFLKYKRESHVRCILKVIAAFGVNLRKLTDSVDCQMKFVCFTREMEYLIFLKYFIHNFLRLQYIKIEIIDQYIEIEIKS